MTATTEICNGLDDDCDGDVDEDVTLSMAELADAGAEPDGGCTVGVGACMRTGAVFCSSAGVPRCGAIVGTPGSETCNGIDDDCDGEVDEGVQITCLVDSDDDQFADGTATVMACPNPARPAFGDCPMGSVSAGASRGLDCAPNDPARTSLQQARADSDGDGACLGMETSVCAGATLPSGYTAPSSCAAAEDCDDGDATRQQLVLVHTDVDADTYCVGAPHQVCAGATAPAGTRFPSGCAATTDCDDGAASRYASVSVRPDADNDGYCSSAAASSQCTGGAALPGFRLAASCNAEHDCDEASSSRYRLVNLQADADGDQHCMPTPTPTCVGAVAIAPGYIHADFCLDLIECDDTNASVYRTVAMRRDQDNDGYCGGTGTTDLCVGTAAPAGYRFPASCPATLDCRDTNPNATTSCTQTVQSNQQSKYCDTGIPATQSLTFSFQCPTGFFATGVTPVRPGSTCIDGACTSFSAFTFTGGNSQSVSFTCDFAAVGRDDWRLNVACTAN